MAQFQRLLTSLSWAGGLICLLIAMTIRIAPRLYYVINIEPRAWVTFAIALFLCSLATREMARAS
jgi:hypothetical protein